MLGLTGEFNKKTLKFEHFCHVHERIQNIPYFQDVNSNSMLWKHEVPGQTQPFNV